MTLRQMMHGRKEQRLIVLTLGARQLSSVSQILTWQDRFRLVGTNNAVLKAYKKKISGFAIGLNAVVKQ